MRRLKPLLWGVMLVTVWFGATSDVAPEEYGGWAPFFMKRADLEKSVFFTPGERLMEDPGKIWITDSHIFIVERYKGVHIIDNTDRENPRHTGFISAPGCMDVAVKENLIYLDNAVDMVAFDLDAKEVTARIADYFPEPANPEGDRFNNPSTDMILVGWKQLTSQQERP